MPNINDLVCLSPSVFPRFAHLVGTVEGINYGDCLVSVSFFDETTGDLEVIHDVPSVFVHVLEMTHQTDHATRSGGARMSSYLDIG